MKWLYLMRSLVFSTLVFIGIYIVVLLGEYIESLQIPPEHTMAVFLAFLMGTLFVAFTYAAYEIQKIRNKEYDNDR